MPYRSEYTHEQVLNDVWSCLRNGVKHGAHPFHTPVLANTKGDDPDLRTVVLRAKVRTPMNSKSQDTHHFCSERHVRYMDVQTFHMDVQTFHKLFNTSSKLGLAPLIRACNACRQGRPVLIS